ncbi:hypothetical protein [Streptomyces sp. NPDC051662]|uniref:hypothetical protein n=1 Tax=Streptomyces sp. NPDC051662 TaxID=3154750 RepID=UPI00341702DE
MTNSSLKRQVPPRADLAEAIEAPRAVSLIGEDHRPDDAQITLANVEAPRPQPRDEVEVLEECVGLLKTLDDAGRRRVLAYINDRFGSRD